MVPGPIDRLPDRRIQLAIQADDGSLVKDRYRVVLAPHWKEGHSGAFAMGIEHGAFCLGCCWVLMSLLFVAGVMNLFWVAALAIFVLLEKVVPGGVVLGRLTGALLLLAGLSLATHPYWT